MSVTATLRERLTHERTLCCGVTVACYAAQTRHNNPVGATRDAATRLKYNTRRGAGGVSNERNGASRGDVMKPSKNFTTHRTQRKRWFARNSRRTPVSDISFDACFACHYPKPIVHLRRALSRRLRAFFTFRPPRQLPQRGPARTASME